MRLFDPSLYYSRKQADLRYSQVPRTPPAPVLGEPSVEAYVEGRQRAALLRVPFTPPATPSWVPASQTSWIANLVFEVSYGDTVHSFVFNAGDAGDYRLQPLPCGQSAQVRACLTDYLGQQSPFSAWTVVVELPGDTAPPAAPHISGIALAAGAQVSLDSLNSESDFSHYVLQRSPDNAVWDDLKRFTEAGTTDLAVELSHNYYYRVQAWDFSGNSATSNTVGPLFLTATGSPAPASVSIDLVGSVANPDGTNLVKWAVSAEAGAHYRVWRRVSGAAGFVLLCDQLPLLSYLDDAAIDGVSYDYAVSVVNDANDESPLSATVTLITHDTVPPDAVGWVVFSAAPGQITAQWQPSANSKVRYYELRWRYNIDADPWSAPLAVVGSSYTIQGLLKPGTSDPPTMSELANSFEVEVVACESAARKSAPYAHRIDYVELTHYVPADGVAPAPPTWDATPAVVNKDGSIEIRFNASLSVDRWGYVIEIWDSKSNVWSFATSFADATSGLKTYKQRGLEAYSVSGITYQFRVATLDSSGMVSNRLTSGVLAAADTTPPADYDTQLTVTPMVGAFGLVWKNPVNDRDYIGGTFEVWRKTTAPVAKVHDWKKIGEVLSAADGAEVRFTDDDPDETTAWTSRFALKVRDRYNNLFGGQNITATDFLTGQPAAQASLLATSIGLLRKDELTPAAPEWYSNGADILPTVANADGSVTLNWSEAATAGRNDLAGYNIWRRPHGDSGAGQKVGSFTSQSGSGLQKWSEYPDVDTVWDYALTAFDTALEESGKSTWMPVTPADNRAPDTTGVAISAQGSFGRIEASWTAMPRAVKYNIRVKNVENGTWSAWFDINSTAYTVLASNGTPPATAKANFAIEVKGVNRSGIASATVSKSGLTDAEVNTYLPMDTTPPAQPDVIAATGDYNGTITVTFSYSNPANKPRDVNRYILESTNDLNDDGTPKADAFWQALATIPVNSTTGYKLTGLRPYRDTGVKYHFRVWAVDNSNLISLAATTTSVPALVPTDSTQPTKPTNLGKTTSVVADPGGNTSSVSIAWDGVPDIDLLQYELQCSRADGAGSAINVVSPKDQAVASATGLAGGYSWNFMVRSVDNAGNRSDWSDVHTVTVAGPAPPVVTKPTTPGAPTGSYDDTVEIVSLNWTYDMVGQGVTSFKVQRCSGSTEGTYSDLGTTPTKDYDDGVPQSATTTLYRWYRVVAVKADGTPSDPGPGYRVTIPRYIPPPTDTCPATEMYVRRQLKAGEVKAGMFMKGVTDDLTTPRKWRVKENSIHLAHCVRLAAANGAEVVLSRSTPMVLRDLSQVYAEEMDGREVLTDVGQGLEWSPCKVYDAGYRPVAHIALGGHVFRAGTLSGKWIYSHNFAAGRISTK